MLSLIIIIIVIGSLSTFIGFMGIYIYREGSSLWEERKEFNFRNKITMSFYLFLEMKVFERNKYYKEAVARHLAAVYDYLVIKQPDMFLANQVLREETKLEILDYCNTPKGRIFKVKIDATKKHCEKVIVLSIDNITKETYKIKEKAIDKDRPKLRVIK